MRNGNNKRMRGRNNNRGGKGPNPLSRGYESNGPDVKIRGTAQHIAEKYLQLARDAHSSGDPVAAENYLQHAEHYFRIIAAAHDALRQQNPYAGQPGAEDDSDEGDDDDEFASPFDKRFESPVQVRPEPPQGQPRNEFGGQREFQGQNREFQGQNREFQGQNREFQGQNREFQGERRDFQGQNRGERFPERQRFPDRQRFQADPSAAEQPDLAGQPEAEGGAQPPRDGVRPDGRPYESRRERFERRRAERFADRGRRDGAPEGDGSEAAEPQAPAAPREVREPAPREPAPREAAPREPVRHEEEVNIGLPAFITGGGAPAAAAAVVEEAAPAPKPRRRRTPRISSEEGAVEAGPEKTTAE
ncbi:MAG: DUF4167 domain-containing protein [Rhizobiales bacterium]|nr:DUF4167 domain-containing protein [Hyphomicrobiales bacterium]